MKYTLLYFAGVRGDYNDNCSVYDVEQTYRCENVCLEAYIKCVLTNGPVDSRKCFNC